MFVQTLRGHHGSALSHVRSGVKILSEVHTNEHCPCSSSVLSLSTYPYVGLPTLELFFSRLDSQIAQVNFLVLSTCQQKLLDLPRSRRMLTRTQMLGTRPMLLQTKPSDKVPGFCAEVPAIFSSLEEARNSMDYQWNKCVHLLGDIEQYNTYAKIVPVKPHLDANQQAFSIVVRKWLVAFQALLQKDGKSFDHKSLQAARTLQINQIFMMIYNRMSIFDVLIDETVWDRFLSCFKQILDFCSLIVESTACDHISQKPGPEFCLDMNIVAPLYAVAHRCRDPAVRRKAISLLYNSPRQEGIWDSILTARVAERLMGIEEEGLGIVTCAADIPDWARITDVNVKFDFQGRLGTVSYSSKRSRVDTVREMVTETIGW